MGAIFILPHNANVVGGIYSGISKFSSKISIESTDNTLYENSFSYNNHICTK